MTPHPYSGLPYRPLVPADTPWKCSDCGNTCEAWRCEICRELHCGYDRSGPVLVLTLNEGAKNACMDCARVNVDDVAVRDLKQARAILADLHCGAFDDLEADENPRQSLGHSIEYIDRRTAEERGIGYSEFISEMLLDSLAALKKPVSTEAHDYAALYAERFGEVTNA